ncbi:MAG: hypothetical protein E6772_07640 [Dysgonomonas sp.]|nr:hypothetical protein [Dysgonomonas sp.]
MKTITKTDLYTRIVLTIIAVCLTINLLKDFQIITTAQANNPTSIAAPDASQSRNQIMDVNIVQIGGRSATSSSVTLPVEIKSTGRNLPVEVKNSVKIQKY